MPEAQRQSPLRGSLHLIRGTRGFILPSIFTQSESIRALGRSQVPDGNHEPELHDDEADAGEDDPQPPEHGPAARPLCSRSSQEARAQYGCNETICSNQATWQSVWHSQSLRAKYVCHGLTGLRCGDSPVTRIYSRTVLEIGIIGYFRLSTIEHPNLPNFLCSASARAPK